MLPEPVEQLTVYPQAEHSRSHGKQGYGPAGRFASLYGSDSLVRVTDWVKCLSRV
ncbi:hypothetical protein GCM10009647_038610 [Streptomyces sanglieri]